jgi:hypothetical protein
MATFDAAGHAEPGWICLQLKAAETLVESGGDYIFDVDVRDYHLWQAEPMPVILVLFAASKRRAAWLHLQPYFAEDTLRRPRRGGKSVRVRIPKSQMINRKAVAAVRAIKQEIIARFNKALRIWRS